MNAAGDWCSVDNAAVAASGGAAIIFNQPVLPMIMHEIIIPKYRDARRHRRTRT